LEKTMLAALLLAKAGIASRPADQRTFDGSTGA